MCARMRVTSAFVVVIVTTVSAVSGCDLRTCHDRCLEFEDQLKELGRSAIDCENGDAEACEVADAPCAHYESATRDITDCKACEDFFQTEELVAGIDCD